MVGRLILILGDQLTRDLPMLVAADRAEDTIVMAEVRAEGTYVPHHPQNPCASNAIACLRIAWPMRCKPSRHLRCRRARFVAHDGEVGPSRGTLNTWQDQGGVGRVRKGEAFVVPLITEWSYPCRDDPERSVDALGDHPTGGLSRDPWLSVSDARADK